MDTVVVTGGSSGIGKAIANVLAINNYRVITASRRKMQVSTQKNLIHYQLDITNEHEIDDFFRNIKREYGDIKSLINNAGFSEWRSIENIDAKFLNQIFAINVNGYFLATKYALAYSDEIKNIINISSLAAMRGTKNNSAYVASKFAIRGFTQSLAKELGPSGIKVNAINPVLIETPGLIEALVRNESPAQGDPKNFLDEFARTQTALGRLPRAEDVGNLVMFLLSDGANSITGQSINIDCGVLPN